MEKIKEICEEYNWVIGLVTLIIVFSSSLSKSNDEVKVTLKRVVLDSNSEEDKLAIKGEVCRRGITSIANKQLDNHTICPDLIKKLNEVGYEDFDNLKKLHTKMRSKSVCIALLKFNDEQNRVFDLDLVENKDMDFGSCVTDINERLETY